MGKKGMCFGVIDILGAVDVVASMGKRVFFKWTVSISKSKMERIGTLFWLQIREVKEVKVCNVIAILYSESCLELYFVLSTTLFCFFHG